MKEYKKIYDCKEFKKRINKTIENIKKIDNNYQFIIEEDEEQKNYIYLHIYYNKNKNIITHLKYNTIDVISDYLRGIEDHLKIQKEIEKNI